MPALDVLRGVAILLVIGAHLEVPAPAGVAGYAVHLWAHAGWLGVELFFVLSGFLIGGLLLSELESRGKIRVGRFLIRRGFKIYPLYFLFIAYLIWMPTAKALFAGDDAWAMLRAMWARYWPQLVFAQSYVGENTALHTWTLAVEEHFYLLLPLGMAWVAACGRTRWLVPGCLLLVPAAVLMLRTAAVLADAPYADSMIVSHFRLDALLFGVGLRAAAQYWPNQFAALGRARGALVALGALLWLPVLLVTPPVVKTVGFTCTFLGAGAFLVAAYHARAADFGALRPAVPAAASALAWVGTYSYAIYLWHVTVMGFADRVAGEPIASHLGVAEWPIRAAVIVASVIAFGACVTRLIERPVLLARDRWFPSRSSAAAGDLGVAPGRDIR